MVTIVKFLALSVTLLIIWGACLTVESLQMFAKFHSAIADIRAEQEVNREAIKVQRAQQNQIAQGLRNLQNERPWKIKHYTCVDDGKQPGNPTYCITKDGTKLTEANLKPHNRIVAVKPGRLPLGTLVEIEGVGFARVADWGDLNDDELDLWVGENNQAEAIQMGVQRRNVTIIERRNKNATSQIVTR